MKVDSANPYLFTANVRERTGKSESGNFANALLNGVGGKKDSYVPSERKSDYLWENYSDLFLNAANKSYYTGSIKTVETERYKIVERESGVVRIYDKEKNNEAVDLKLNTEKVQVDKKTGTKLIINDLGVGFFTMMTVDAELEAGLKEALGVDELDEKELTGFTVHTDQKTGIKYVTANGYESRGGAICMDNEAKQKLDSLAKEFLEQYPNLAKTYNEAWFYATFEVRGLLQRTPNGITMLSPNSISFKDKDGENGWVSVFNPENWNRVKEEFDSGRNIGKMEGWNFWKEFFDRWKIDASLVTPDSSYDRRE
ncbi:MAG: hypothetical protein K2M22_06425 [Lachnospiraceae bacterium]|nr:hypothetical protein [Lachnospiraceae bacterium]